METGWYDTVDPSFFAFPARRSFMNWHLAGLCKGKRAFMWGVPSLPGWLPLGHQEPAIRVMTMMTNGCVPAHSVPGRDVMARYMADIAAREEYLRDARLHPWCGLVVSEKTERWYGRDEGIGDALACWHLAQPRGGTVSIGACMENSRDGAACMSLRGIADWACGESERIAVVTVRSRPRMCCSWSINQLNVWGGPLTSVELGTSPVFYDVTGGNVLSPGARQVRDAIFAQGSNRR